MTVRPVSFTLAVAFVQTLYATAVATPGLDRAHAATASGHNRVEVMRGEHCRSGCTATAIDRTPGHHAGRR